MRKRWLIWAGVIGLGLALAVCPRAAGAAAQGEGGAAKGATGAARESAGDALQRQHPPGWATWSKAQQAQWSNSLDAAREKVRTRARMRERAALGAMETAARRGVSVSDAAQMATAGLDEGLDAEDFEPLGRAVSQWTHEGKRGNDLAAAVHEAIQRRKQHRRMVRAQEEKQKALGRGAQRGRGTNENMEAEEEGEGEAGAAKPAAAGKGRGAANSSGKGGGGKGRGAR